MPEHTWIIDASAPGNARVMYCRRCKRINPHHDPYGHLTPGNGLASDSPVSREAARQSVDFPCRIPGVDTPMPD